MILHFFSFFSYFAYGEYPDCLFIIMGLPETNCEGKKGRKKQEGGPVNEVIPEPALGSLLPSPALHLHPPFLYPSTPVRGPKHKRHTRTG
jgi:hypothetical protein